MKNVKKNKNTLIAILSGLVVCSVCVIAVLLFRNPSNMNNENQDTGAEYYDDEEYYEDDEYYEEETGDEYYED